MTLTPKSDKNSAREENYRPMSTMKVDTKTLNIILANQIQKHHTRHDQVGFVPGMQGWFEIQTSINMAYYRSEG